MSSTVFSDSDNGPNEVGHGFSSSSAAAWVCFFVCRSAKKSDRVRRTHESMCLPRCSQEGGGEGVVGDHAHQPVVDYDEAADITVPLLSFSPPFAHLPSPPLSLFLSVSLSPGLPNIFSFSFLSPILCPPLPSASPPPHFPLSSCVFLNIVTSFCVCEDNVRNRQAARNTEKGVPFGRGCGQVSENKRLRLENPQERTRTSYFADLPCLKACLFDV